jgi:tetratricopeptide (TPR) repeat protein
VVIFIWPIKGVVCEEPDHPLIGPMPVELKRLIQESPVVTVIFAVALSYYLFSDNSPEQVSAPMEIAPDAYLTNSDTKVSGQSALDQSMDVSTQLAQINFDNQALELEIQRLLSNGEYKKSTTMLLEAAAVAIAQGEKKKLGNIMLLLGRVATNAQELDTAEVYLQEALDIALQSGDTMAAARTYQQFGRVHIRSRELARNAGEAYDILWIARNQLYMGQYREAKANLDHVIDTNLAIRRYGAAAGAFETLSEYHRRFHDNYMAQDASMEAARLYASSGQIMRSRGILDALKNEGLDDLQVESMQAEIDDLFERHQNDVRQTAIAHDYQMLYRHYKAKGDDERAWKLRILASKSLANTSSRSMYQRQPDVLAILYMSNFTMDKAKNYLDQASSLFADQGEDDLSASTQDLYSLIY